VESHNPGAGAYNRAKRTIMLSSRTEHPVNGPAVTSAAASLKRCRASRTGRLRHRISQRDVAFDIDAALKQIASTARAAVTLISKCGGMLGRHVLRLWSEAARLCTAYRTPALGPKRRRHSRAWGSCFFAEDQYSRRIDLADGLLAGVSCQNLGTDPGCRALTA